MVFIGVIVGVAVLAGLAIWAFRRRGSDEVHSVAGYQHRLARLEEVRRRQAGAVRMLGGTSQTEERGGPPVVGEDGRIEISSSSVPRRLEDTGQIPVHTERRPPPPYRRPREVSMARISRRPRRLAAPIAAAVAVIILVTALAIAGARSRTPNSTTNTTIGHHGATTHSTSTTTTSTTARPAVWNATSSTGYDATYQLPFASYTVAFTATTGDCYIEVTNAQGQVPYASVLNAGQTEQLTLTGNSKVDLGAPTYVQVKIDRTPLAFPAQYQAPLNLILNASGSGIGTTTTTTTTAPGG
jgi:hypothetical protein